VEEFGACYCALYVKKEAFEGKMQISSIPERRPLEKQVRTSGALPEASGQQTATPIKPEEAGKIGIRLWYCKQCGYVVFREEPPYICPICKAKRELFAAISIGAYPAS
jgi:rubrerythrin